MNAYMKTTYQSPKIAQGTARRPRPAASPGDSTGQGSPKAAAASRFSGSGVFPQALYLHAYGLAGRRHGGAGPAWRGFEEHMKRKFVACVSLGALLAFAAFDSAPVYAQSKKEKKSERSEKQSDA